jgi:DNA processing protein
MGRHGDAGTVVPSPVSSRLSIPKRMSAEDVGHWIALNMIPGVGGATFRRLVKFFGSPGAALSASLRDLSKIRGLTPAVCQSIVEHRDSISIDRELDIIERHGCQVITIQDESYPANLKAIYDPPQVLYVKGDLLPTDSLAVSVVGTRTASSYGKMAAEKISNHLAARNVTVISGMAYGIDAAAHKGALSAGGRTIAIMGNGLDIVYPSRNASLLEKIIGSGAAISEFPMGTPPLKNNFPRRNRVISGLSLGTLVVEAPKRSGALITAYYALDQGREVFAVPGQIFSEMSGGTHDLIKQGAKLVESVDDILDELPSYALQPVTEEDVRIEEERMELQLSEEEKAVWKVIGSSLIHIDDVSRQSALPPYKVSAALVMLELKGLVQQSAGKMFARKVSILDS